MDRIRRSLPAVLAAAACGLARAFEPDWPGDPAARAWQELPPTAPLAERERGAERPADRTDAVRIAFLGDQGPGPGARAVLSLVRAEGAGLLVVLGDFDYQNDPGLWDRMLDESLGASFPVIAALGNHDMPAARGYKAKLAARLARTGPSSGLDCRGEAGERAVCRFGPAAIVLLGFGTAGSRRGDAFIREAFPAEPGPFRFCAWHVPEPEMQVGGKTDGVGWSVYEHCRRAGAIVATGHEHSYSRTHLLEDYPGKRVVRAGGPLALREGRSLAFVSGLGGHSVRPQRRGGDWWAAVHTASQGARFGALFCDLGQDRRGECYFKDVAGRVVDSFELVSELGAGSAPSPNASASDAAWAR